MTKTLFKGISRIKNSLLSIIPAINVKKQISNITNKVIKYAKRDRIIAISLLSRILTLVLVSSFIPVTNSYADEQLNPVFESNLSLDVSKSAPLVINGAKASVITPGESNNDKRIREDNEKKVALKRASNVRQVVARDNRVYDVSFEQKRNLAKLAASKYGIDWKILEAVWQVESGKTWLTTVKSYAGAQGPMQFMPRTWSKYAVDGNSDGVKDISDAQDAVYAGANYLAQSGASSGNVDQALFSYNHAQWYVDKVKGVAASINE